MADQFSTEKDFKCYDEMKDILLRSQPSAISGSELQQQVSDVQSKEILVKTEPAWDTSDEMQPQSSQGSVYGKEVSDVQSKKILVKTEPAWDTFDEMQPQSSQEAYEDENSVHQSTLDDQTSTLDDQTSTLDDQTSTLEDQTSNNSELAIKANSDFWIEFIVLYHDEPSLWKIKSKSYMNRGKKARAYNKIFQKYKEMFPNGTLKEMKKKINNMRSNFRKELKKMENSKRSGAPTEELYEPTLWYFSHLMFLIDQETQLGSDNEDGDCLPMESKNNVQVSAPSLISDPSRCYTTGRSSIPPSPSPMFFHRKRKQKNMTAEVLSVIKDKLYEPIKSDDYFDLVGKTWASKMRNLPPNIRLVAEKSVNDILFDAEMGILAYPRPSYTHYPSYIQPPPQNFDKGLFPQNVNNNQTETYSTFHSPSLPQHVSQKIPLNQEPNCSRTQSFPNNDTPNIPTGQTYPNSSKPSLSLLTSNKTDTVSNQKQSTSQHFFNNFHQNNSTNHSDSSSSNQPH